MTEIAELCNTHAYIIDRFVRLGLVDPVGPDENSEQWAFQREVIPQVQKIIRLRNELGINYAGIGVVLDLLSRIEQLEAQIRMMQGPPSRALPVITIDIVPIYRIDPILSLNQSIYIRADHSEHG